MAYAMVATVVPMAAPRRGELAASTPILRTTLAAPKVAADINAMVTPALDNCVLLSPSERTIIPETTASVPIPIWMVMTSPRTAAAMTALNSADVPPIGATGATPILSTAINLKNLAEVGAINPAKISTTIVSRLTICGGARNITTGTRIMAPGATDAMVTVREFVVRRAFLSAIKVSAKQSAARTANIPPINYQRESLSPF